ncbi:hypothetical protein [Microcoleus vaginatus]
MSLQSKYYKTLPSVPEFMAIAYNDNFSSFNYITSNLRYYHN